MKNKKEVIKFLELIANSVGETITEYHWREACGLIAGIEPPATFHYKTQEGSVIIPDPKDYDYRGECAELTLEAKEEVTRFNEGLWNKLENARPYEKTPLEKFAIYREKYPWLEESNDHECLNGMHINKFKIPFNYLYLVDGDRLENESGESLIYREQDNAYTFINNDCTRFLSKSMIYQEWKKL